MRFMISYEGINKLMQNGTNFNQILNFVYENYNLKVSEYHMYYIDHEGDAITLDSQTDLKIMLQNNMKEQIKLYIQAINDKTKPQEQKLGLPVYQDKINQNYPKIEENISNQKCHIQLKFQSQNIQNRQNQQKIFNISQKKYQIVKDAFILQQQMEQNIVKLVDQRIKTLMPLIKKQIRQQLISKQQNIEQKLKQKPTIHNIKCNTCGIQPIIGIRYKCTKCVLFNICQNCQRQAEHNHNMIKIKYIEKQQQVINVKLQQKKEINKLVYKQKSLLMQQVKLYNKFQKQPQELFQESNIFNKNAIKIKQNTQQNFKVQKITKETKIQQPKIDTKVDKVQKIVPPIVTIPIFSPANIVKSTKKTNMGKRNQCVLLMKQMFGEINIFKYIQFFKKHSEETIETIIQLYIQQNGKNN